MLKFNVNFDSEKARSKFQSYLYIIYVHKKYKIFIQYALWKFDICTFRTRVFVNYNIYRYFINWSNKFEKKETMLLLIFSYFSLNNLIKNKA